LDAAATIDIHAADPMLISKARCGEWVRGGSGGDFSVGDLPFGLAHCGGQKIRRGCQGGGGGERRRVGEVGLAGKRLGWGPRIYRPELALVNESLEQARNKTS